MSGVEKEYPIDEYLADIEAFLKASQTMARQLEGMKRGRAEMCTKHSKLDAAYRNTRETLDRIEKMIAEAMHAGDSTGYKYALYNIGYEVESWRVKND